MALVYDVVKKLNGKFDGDAAMGVIKAGPREPARPSASTPRPGTSCRTSTSAA